MVSESNGSPSQIREAFSRYLKSETELHPEMVGGKGSISYARFMVDFLRANGEEADAKSFQKDLDLQLEHSHIIYIKNPLLRSDWVLISTLGSGLGGHPLAYSTQYGHGLFEGIKFVPGKDGIFGFHFSDNFERMKEGCSRLSGYSFNYPIDKLVYSTFMLAGLNGWFVEWPKINGKPAYIIYGRPIVTQPLDGNVGVVSPVGHAKELNIITIPFEEYFGEKEQKSGINVFVFDTPIKQQFSFDENATKHSSNYSWVAEVKTAANEIPGVKEICFFNNGMMKGDGTGDNFGLITDDSVIFTHLNIGRLNGITALYVEDISPGSGYNVKFDDISFDQLVLAKGLLALGNAVDKNGVNLAYVPEEYSKYLTSKEAKEKWASLKKETHLFDGKPMEMRVLEFHTMQTPIYQAVKAAFEKAFPSYSLAANDILVPNAAEILHEVGKMYQEQMPPDSLEWRRLPLPNLLRDDAPSLISDKGLYPRPFKRVPIEDWRKQLQTKKVFSVAEGYGFKQSKLILTK